MLKWFLHKIQFVLLLVSPLLLFVFMWGLIQKIANPNSKNLPANEYIIGGIILIALLSSDYFFIKNRFKRQK
jgi:hypothetical protein